MASEVQTGTAILFGITNSGTPISMMGYATFIIESTKGSHKFEIDAIKGENNFDMALIATNGHVELDVTWTPSGATRAAAAATAVFLTPLAKVTLANFQADAFNGDYVYVGDQSVELSHKQAKMSLKVRKYDDAEQNESLTTTVSG